ncbi:MAG TPA: hypothetical protein VNL13_04510 [Sulfolobales archaeon]|nr:hypothetical protein [Sulfolobales archaeon]
MAGFYRDRGEEDLCALYEKLLRDLSIIVETQDYLDKRGALTSEGRAYLISIIRYMAINRLRCIEVVKQLLERFSKIESVYECIQNALDSCRSE